VNLTTHLHLVPRLRVTGAVPPVPVYASVARAGTTLFVPFISDQD